MKGITLHPGQDRAIRSDKRFIGVVSGIQGGKTTLGCIWLCDKIYQNYKNGKTGDYLIAAPTVKILQQSTLPKFKEIFPSDWGEWKEQRQCFDLVWGGHIYVRSTEEPDHLEGMTLLAAWLDEVGQMKHQAWTNVQGRLSINMGPCIMTTTPYALNWFWTEVVKKYEVDPNIDLISWRSIDNPSFPKAEFERAKASLPKAIFERRYLGKFTRMEGLVYPDVDEENFVDPFPIPGEWRKFGGLDFGHTHPTALVCIAEKPEVREKDKKGNEVLKEPSVFYVYKEFYKSNALLREIALFLDREPLERVLADPRGAQEISELQRVYGQRMIKKADNKVDIGIERIAVLIKEKRLKFVRGRAKHTIDELETYHYATQSPDRPSPDKPVDKDDHTMDALKYAFSIPFQSLYQKRVLPVKRRYSSRLRFAHPDPYTGYY